MDKEQQIKEIEEVLINKYKYNGKHCDDCEHWFGNFCGAPITCEAEALYAAGYRKVPFGTVILTPEERDEEMKAYNDERAEFDAEIERLKAQLAEFEKPVTQFVKDRETQAVKEFAEKLKENSVEVKSNEWGFMDFVDVNEIDELLKEYEQ